jgi:hypothetical protein
MCEPMSIGVGIAAAATVAGSAYGAAKADEIGSLEARTLEQNADAKDKAAAQADAAGTSQATAAKVKASQEIGQARAELGGSGLDLSRGSPLDAIGDARMLSELDVQTIRNNAAREAWGYRVAAMNDRVNADLTRKGARQKVTGTLLGGAASLGTLMAGGAGGG